MRFVAPYNSQARDLLTDVLNINYSESYFSNSVQISRKYCGDIIDIISAIDFDIEIKLKSPINPPVLNIAKSIFLQVTPEELAKHNKPGDSWMAVHGKVYKVDAYFPFHPGGEEELAKGIGKDATELFLKVRKFFICNHRLLYIQ